MMRGGLLMGLQQDAERRLDYKSRQREPSRKFCTAMEWKPASESNCHMIVAHRHGVCSGSDSERHRSSISRKLSHQERNSGLISPLQPSRTDVACVAIPTKRTQAGHRGVLLGE